MISFKGDGATLATGTSNYSSFASTCNSDNNYYEGTIGIKTGFTTEAKNCFIGAVSRNGYELYCFIMGAPTVNKESQRYPDKINVGGNIMSLINYNDSMQDYCFYGLF